MKNCYFLNKKLSTILASILFLATSLLSIQALATLPDNKTQNKTKTKAIAVNPEDPVQKKLAILPKEQQLKQQRLQIQMQELRLLKQLIQLKTKQIKLYQLGDTRIRTQQSKAYHWQAIKDNKIPKNALVAGTDNNKSLYVCQASYIDGVHPGQWAKKGCLISYGGKSYKIKKYKILTAKGTTEWQPYSALSRFIHLPHYFPINAGPGPYIPAELNMPLALQPIIGGYEHGHNRALYICRGIYANHIHIGKVVTGNCNISYQGHEVLLNTFEVLFN